VASLLLCLLVVQPAASSPEAAAPSYAVERLSVEHLQAPAPCSRDGCDDPTLLAIDVPSPRLSWVLVPSAGKRGVVQAAYQIQVHQQRLGLRQPPNAGPGSPQPGKLVWDSGRVASNRTTLIECCGGAELLSDTTYVCTPRPNDPSHQPALPPASQHHPLPQPPPITTPSFPLRRRTLHGPQPVHSH